MRFSSMREFTQEEYTRIELGGYINLPKEYADGTQQRTLAEYLLKFISGGSLIDDVEILNDAMFRIYANGAKVEQNLCVIPEIAFDSIANFKQILNELKDSTAGNVDTIYRILLILFASNKIRIFLREEFIGNLVVPRTFMYGAPPVTESMQYIDKIINLIENDVNAFVVFVNNQDAVIEAITVHVIRDIISKEEALSDSIQATRRENQQLKDIIEKSAEENKQIYKNNEETIKKNKDSIITIVSLIVTIVPLLIVNLSVLVNSFNLILLLCINGILLCVVAVIYYFVERIVKDIPAKGNKTFIAFICIGLALLLIGIIFAIVAACVPVLAEFFKNVSL